MSRFASITAALFVIALPVSQAHAAPSKSSTGQACTSSGTKSGVSGTEEGTGKKLSCTADYCTFTKCDTSGSTISGCKQVTEYSNVRDCKPAALTFGGRGSVLPGAVLKTMQAYRIQ